MEPEIRYCATSDGVSIAYYAMGEGPPIVITSGILFSNLNAALVTLPEFHRQGSGFGRGQRFVRYDARGSGMSDRSILDFSIEARVCDLEAVVDHLALESFDLIATGHGVATAIAYAERHPKRVRNLLLVDGYARGALFAELPGVRAYSSFRDIAEESWGTIRSLSPTRT